jgi:hypothetical protein
VRKIRGTSIRGRRNFRGERRAQREGDNPAAKRGPAFACCYVAKFPGGEHAAAFVVEQFVAIAGRTDKIGASLATTEVTL